MKFESKLLKELHVSTADEQQPPVMIRQRAPLVSAARVEHQPSFRWHALPQLVRKEHMLQQAKLLRSMSTGRSTENPSCGQRLAVHFYTGLGSFLHSHLGCRP
jgi:hypothetical protein